MKLFGEPNHRPGAGKRPGLWATERQMEALVYLASYGIASAADVGRDLAHGNESLNASASDSRGRAILAPLVRLGFVAKPRSGYAITERGRIAAALVLFHNPAMLPAFFDED